MSKEDEEELKKTSKKAAKKAVAKKSAAKKAPKKKVIKKEEVAAKEPSSEKKDTGKSERTDSTQDSKAKAVEPTIAVVEESSGEIPEEKQQDSRGPKRRVRGSRRGGNRDGERPERGPKRPIDASEAAAKAWEIYQGELEEEGVSLVDARRGRELARRCLELATVFCEERDTFLARQKRSAEKPQNTKVSAPSDSDSTKPAETSVSDD